MCRSLHLGKIDREQRAAEQIRLLLVVAFEANPVARPNDGLQQPRDVARLDDLAARQPGSRPRGGRRVLRADAARSSLALVSAFMDINMWKHPDLTDGRSGGTARWAVRQN